MRGYITFNTCSLICSSSSFICTTMFCICAWFRLAAGGIDFASHFLCDESQFLSLTVSVGHGFTEIVQVIAQTLLLFVDIQFFDIIDQLLFQTVFVVIGVEGLFQCLCNAFTDFRHTLFLERFDGFQQVFDVVDFFCEFLFQGQTFLLAEVGQVLQGLLYGLAYRTPFFFGQFLDVDFRQYIGHAEQRGKPVFRERNVAGFRDAFNLADSNSQPRLR